MIRSDLSPDEGDRFLVELAIFQNENNNYPLNDILEVFKEKKINKSNRQDSGTKWDFDNGEVKRL